MEAIRVWKLEDVRNNFYYIEEILNSIVKQTNENDEEVDVNIDHYLLNVEEIPTGKFAVEFEFKGETELLLVAIKNVWSENFGDGNEMYNTHMYTIPVIKNVGGVDILAYENVYITSEGYYSSWSCSEYERYYYSKPYEFSETRYDMRHYR